MKFLVLVNAAKNYKYFYFSLAKALESQGHEVLFALDSKRSIYLEPLKEIDESEQTFFFDDYLKRYFDSGLSASEKADGTCFWGDLFYSDFDRFVTHNFNLNHDKNYWLNVKSRLDTFFDEIICDNQIDHILYENISNSFAYAAYRAGMRHHCRYIGLMGARLPGHFEIQNSIIDEEVDKIEKLSQLPLTEEESKWYEEYKRKIIDIQPDYMKQNGLDNVALSRLLNVRKIGQFLKLLWIGFRYDSYYDYQFGCPFKSAIKGVRINLWRAINARRAQKYYTQPEEFEHASSKEQFFVYPIHFHPESSTSVLAPEYTNEYTNIVNIANNLPFGTYLYVKDHKSAIGTQDGLFYKRVAALPNVRFIEPDHNIKQLINQSLGVITVNSTAGFEALILGKPVFLLGRVFYERFPNVHRLAHFREIREIDLGVLPCDAIDQHVVAYKRYCYEGTLHMTGVQSQDDSCVEQIVDCILLNVENSIPVNKNG